MYGIVYHSLMDYLNDNHSSHKWNAIMSELPDYPAGGFLLFESYDDSTLLNMIGKAIETAKFEPADLLINFGQYWVLETAPKHFGAFLTLAGSDIHQFMSNLNTVHDRASALFPGYQPPSFRISGHLANGDLRIFYSSKREGFENFVVGLLIGVCKRFNINATIKTRGALETGESVFDVRLVS
jgi:hypothetical protein